MFPTGFFLFQLEKSHKFTERFRTKLQGAQCGTGVRHQLFECILAETGKRVDLEFCRLHRHSPPLHAAECKVLCTFGELLSFSIFVLFLLMRKTKVRARFPGGACASSIILSPFFLELIFLRHPDAMFRLSAFRLPVRSSSSL